MGGNLNGNPIKSVERLIVDRNKFELISDFPEAMHSAAAVPSYSNNYLGFVAGGSLGSNYVYGLQRKDLKWVTMSKRLELYRKLPSMVNLGSDQIPGC